MADDAYIAARYAQNLLAGNGYVYNVGESVNGSTSPLNTWLLAVIGVCGCDDFRLAAALVYALAMGATAGLCFAVFRSRGRRFAAVAVGCFVVTTPLIRLTVGLESALLLATVTAAVVAAAARRPVWASVAVGFAALARPDGVLIAVPLWFVFRRAGMRLPWRAMLAGFAIVTVPWFVYAWVVFGWPVPQTLSAKLAQTRSGWWGDGWLFARGLRHSFALFGGERLPDVRYQGFLAAAAAAMAWALLRRHPLAPLVVFGVLQAAAYSLLNVPYYHWYGVPAHFAAVIGLAVTVDSIWGAGGWLRRSVAAAIALAVVVAATPPLQRAAASYGQYRAAAELVRGMTDERAVVGCVEVGVIGHALWPRPIVDACGLVTAGGAARIAAREFWWWVEVRRPDVLILHDPLWPAFEQQGLECVRGEMRRVSESPPGLQVWVRR